MTPSVARKIADGLTWARVASALPLTLLVVLNFRWWFLSLYVLAAFTDAFDGIFARHATRRDNGAEMDGRADIFFAVMTLIWIHLLIPGFFAEYWLAYLPAFVILQGFLIAARFREPGLELPHLEFGRFAVFLFHTLLPVLLVAGEVPWFIYLVFATSITAKLQLVWFVINRQQSMDAV